MRYATALLPAVLWLAACSSSETGQTSTAASPSASDSVVATGPLAPLDTARTSAVTAQSDTLNQVQRRHAFSSAGQQDLFTLTLRGQELLKSEATFTITDASGQVIFREMLSAADLEASMVYEMQTPTATTAQREAYLLRRMDTFFADKNFHRPALPTNATYQPGALDRTSWNALRQRPDAISFEYLVGKEDRRRIAWSQQKKQVVSLGGVGS